MRNYAIALLVLAGSGVASAQLTTPPIVWKNGSTKLGIATTAKCDGVSLVCTGPVAGVLTLTGPAASGGTVTSVSAGTGMSFATITGAGAVAVDTTVVATTSNAITLASKTLTAPVINGATSTGGNFDLSGSSGTFLTPTGNHTFGSAAWAVPANLVVTGGAAATNTAGMAFSSTVADGASSIAYKFSAPTAEATSGDRIASFQVGGAEQIGLSKVSRLGTAARPSIFGDSSNPSLQLSDAGGTILFYGTNWMAINSAVTGFNFTIASGDKVYIDAAAAYPAVDATGEALGKKASRWNGLFNAASFSSGYNRQSGATYTVLSTDWYVGLSNAAARTVTMCAASALPAGGQIIIKDEAGTGLTANVTINRAGGDTIDGGTSATIVTNFGDRILISDGVSKWFLAGSL